MTLPARIVDIAEREIGTRESGGNNHGPRVETYMRASWMGEDSIKAGFPWCAAFTCWVLREWLKDADVRKALNLRDEKAVEAWRCRDASAFGWIKWAQKHGLKILDENRPAKAGDFVVFDFSHIGIVDTDQQGNQIFTIEGNTNGRGTRDSTSGDGVWQKSRDHKLVLNYIRIIP